MKNKFHLFYVGSYSHIIVADAIINEKNLSLDTILFITYRGVKLPSCYEKCLLYDESAINRKKFFLKNFVKLSKLFWGQSVCGYFPFQGHFPVVKFFDDYVFFEEGLSAYDTGINYTRFKKKNYFKTYIKDLLIAPFVNRNMRGLINGRQNGSPFSFKCSLIGLTNTSYKNIIIENCKRETVHFLNRPLKKSTISDSVIIVMDSTHAIDRMDSAEKYLSILSESLKKASFGLRNIYLKLHPDNHKDREEAILLIKKYIDFLDFTVIDESLEDIALSNQNNIFFGNHSTILFYAPIFGNTNKSISFVRQNAECDKTYIRFLQRWGGIEGTLALFKQQMECL